MSAYDLPNGSGKYNVWCERRPLVCADDERHFRAAAVFARLDLSPSEQAAYFLHDMTDCKGLEFVVFSNAEFSGPVLLTGGVILVPCFLHEIQGHGPDDQLLQLTLRMHSECRFIYDGWVPINTWDDAHVRRAVRSIDEALSILCLHGSISCDWEPKYSSPRCLRSTYKLQEIHLLEFERLASPINALSESDKRALYRSLGWLSQSLRLSEPAAKFLFSVLAIEALAIYIETTAPDEESPFAALRAERVPRPERRARREECIHNVISEWLSKDPTKAVETAYFDCVVGIQRRLKAHLERVFGADREPVALLFEQQVEEKSLYALRHDIAHGTPDILSEAQRQQIHRRVWDIERTARRYIMEVLKVALGVQPLQEKLTASMPLPMQNAVLSSANMYQGPTHMAVLYSHFR